MRLGVDLDGVVADFPSAANAFICKELECSPLPVDRWDWFKSYGEEVEPVWERLWNEEVPDGFFLTVNEVPNACDSLDILRTQGHQLVFVTARPASGASDTQAWLEIHGLGGHHLILALSSKSKQFVDVDLLLDDKGDTVFRHLQLGKPAVLFKQPWNREWWHRVPSVCHWGEVLQMVEGLSDG